jgi:hypothetical protein
MDPYKLCSKHSLRRIKKCSQKCGLLYEVELKWIQVNKTYTNVRIIQRLHERSDYCIFYNFCGLGVT